jgi:mRNA interferase MazF
MAAPYCPRQGDVVWLSFDPRTDRGQAGHRPALVLSPERYNHKVGLALFCPITTKKKGYPFEVAIPAGLDVSGVILSDQVKSLDWKARETRFGCELPSETLQEVVAKLSSLLDVP